MANRLTKIMATDVETGETQFFSSITELARRLHDAGVVTSAYDSTCNYLSRLSAQKKTFKGLKLRRVPHLPKEETEAFVRSVIAAERIKGIMNYCIEHPTLEIAAVLEAVVEEMEALKSCEGE